MSKAAKLVEAAQEAAEVRAHQTDPNVVALRVERVRGWVDRLVWTGIVLGLLFTMANVQHFAAGGTKPPWQHDGSIEWVIAWLLDPMVSLVLIGVLMGEQVINRHKVKAGDWVRVIKWVALGCTYAMNTWSAWGSLNPSQILLHSVPPLIVVCATEAITDLRLNITEAVAKAVEAATKVPETVSGTPTDTPFDTAETVSEPVSSPVSNTAQNTTRPVSRTVSSPVSNTATDTPLDTPQNTARPVSSMRASTPQNTPSKRAETPQPRRTKTAKKETREEAARRIYDAHMAEHHEVISNAKLREELKEAGHPTGNRTAADLLVEFKAHPLRLAQ